MEAQSAHLVRVEEEVAEEEVATPSLITTKPEQLIGQEQMH